MRQSSAKHLTVELDLSDVKRRVGQEVGGGELIEPCSSTDIRRWVMAMDYPNPIHWDHEFARASRFGGIVAPQSFAVAIDYGHGAQPACVGHIPGSHLIFGGEEWWHYGPRLRPGDRLTQKRRFHDYKVSDTNFAGPTLFSRGDTLHVDQRGTPVSKVRSTSIRYNAAEAERRGKAKPVAKAPRWKREQLLALERERLDWILSNREGRTPRYEEVSIGDRLPRRVIGPHTLASFATEYRAFVFNVWGSFRWVAPPAVEEPWINQDPGWVEGFGFDEEGARIDPRLRDGLYVGPSRGHVDVDKAAQVGIQRAYGYGATMGAWVTDYVSHWAGHEGFVRYSNTSYRSPAYEGDVTYLDAEVMEQQEESVWGTPLVRLDVKMRNQDGTVLATGQVDVELPR
ncbi:MAG TPA: MaoC family dehydratase N-terminal domain-containing protein [Polyangiales bacterium]|nr:MaoC family dehydratase N-terminal domain-containing protein [Polyangiales bacterium]